MIARLDDLIHQSWMAWVPRLLTGWICDLYDHSLGVTWSEIRHNRHGELPNYWRRYRPGAVNYSTSTTSTIPGAKVTYRSTP